MQRDFFQRNKVLAIRTDQMIPQYPWISADLHTGEVEDQSSRFIRREIRHRATTCLQFTSGEQAGEDGKKQQEEFMHLCHDLSIIVNELSIFQNL